MRAGVAVVVAALLVTGCTAKPQKAPATTETSLRSALLAATDLPAGFTQQTVPDSANLGFSDLGDCPALKTPSSAPATDQATATYVGTGPVVLIGEMLRRTSTADAQSALAQLAQVPAQCGTITNNSLGFALKLGTAAVDFPAVGEERAAVRLTANVAATSIDEYVVAVRSGALVMVLVYTAMGTAAQADVEALVRKAWSKAGQR